MNQFKLLALAAVAAAMTWSQTLQAQDTVQKTTAAPNADAASAEKTGRVTRVKELLNLEVINEQGESYGIIEDLMLNKSTGQV
ncbi:MAG TPA: PRC-barrel domain-containing protein, partial [Planctomycetaceae bacterium]|nr:PRC-barrel domain-containing protein [Planctomycetaceae bacterium]